jgi:hypothetical protein
MPKLAAPDTRTRTYRAARHTQRRTHICVYACLRECTRACVGARERASVRAGHRRGSSRTDAATDTQTRAHARALSDARVCTRTERHTYAHTRARPARLPGRAVLTVLRRSYASRRSCANDREHGTGGPARTALLVGHDLLSEGAGGPRLPLRRAWQSGACEWRRRAASGRQSSGGLDRPQIRRDWCSQKV